MIHIEPSTRLRTDYTRISDIARRTGDPVYITKNGAYDMVIMNAEAFEQRELVLKLSCIIMESEYKRMNGANACSVEDIEAMLKQDAL